MAMVLSFGPLATAHADDTPRAVGFAAAMADLRRERDSIADMPTTLAKLTEMNETFFSRVDLNQLSSGEVAEIVGLNAFAYGQDSNARARDVMQRFEPIAKEATADGALAAAIRALVSGPAGVRGAERDALFTTALHHPAFLTLVSGGFGGFAINIASKVGTREEKNRQLFLAIADQLETNHSLSVAGAIVGYWDKVSALLPEGEQRQAVRRKLVAYLKAALAAAPTPANSGALKQGQRSLALLDGVATRGGLLGAIAPEINFLWSSQEDWKSLADLRGKIVVLDFWATWCGPCLASFPRVAELVKRYEGTDVAIVGVTSIQGSITGFRSKTSIDCRGQPEKELQLMSAFIKEAGMTWPIVVSREPVFNPDYGIIGIPTAVIIAPDGKVRFVSQGLAETETTQQIDALLAEFKLRTPTATAK